MEFNQNKDVEKAINDLEVAFSGVNIFDTSLDSEMKLSVFEEVRRERIKTKYEELKKQVHELFDCKEDMEVKIREATKEFEKRIQEVKNKFIQKANQLTNSIRLLNKKTNTSNTDNNEETKDKTEELKEKS